MKIFSAMTGSFSILLTLTCLGQTAVIDWWEMGQGQASSTLLSDSGEVMGTASLLIESGINFPGFPQARELDGDFWEGSLPVENLQGSTDVTATNLRVVPSGGQASYRAELDWDKSAEIYLMVGQLYSDGTHQSSVNLLADPWSTIELVSLIAWNNSLSEFEESLLWNPSSLSLQGADGSAGDSEFALFRITGTQNLTLEFPAGYPAGSGDEVTFAIGQAIPEPSSGGLLVLASFFFFRRKRS